MTSEQIICAAREATNIPCPRCKATGKVGGMAFSSMKIKNIETCRICKGKKYLTDDWACIKWLAERMAVMEKLENAVRNLKLVPDWLEAGIDLDDALKELDALRAKPKCIQKYADRFTPEGHPDEMPGHTCVDGKVNQIEPNQPSVNCPDCTGDAQ